MNLLQAELSSRCLPDLFIHTDGTEATPQTWEKRRAEFKHILASEEYGFAPEAPASCTVTPAKATNYNMCAGKVTGEYFNVVFPAPQGECSFPVSLFLPIRPIGSVADNPQNARKAPLILLLNFFDAAPNDFLPLEEITDAGFAVAQIYFRDVTSDDDDMTNGLAGCYPRPADAAPDALSWGKLRMWAFAASRLLDVLVQRSDINPHQIVAAGHSRLGKAALLAAAMDERFAGVLANDSGCSGAAVSRGKTGETVGIISSRFPHWFCPNFGTYAGRESDMPFDQHFLAALIPPRLLCIGSAWEDTWADPQSVFLTAVLAARVPVFLKTGTCPEVLTADNGMPLDRCPVSGESYVLGGDTVHYHVRPGTHYFSREDWNLYLAFLKRHFFR